LKRKDPFSWEKRLYSWENTPLTPLLR
jgi:hypothetical protein